MHANSFLIPGLMFAAIFIGIALKGYLKEIKRRQNSVITSKAVLTKNEQPMYFRLAEALPEYVILCQVAFSALVETRDRGTRNTFDRKVADFVICRKSFGVVAVIELDDSSHKGREEQDRRRDAILQKAGHTVLRYRQIPDAEKIRTDLKTALQSKEAA